MTQKPERIVEVGFVDIGPYRYCLHRNSHLDGSDAWGATNFNQRILEFSDACNEEQLPLTLIHEIVHAVSAAYALEPDLTESQVTGLANGISQALRSLGWLPERLALVPVEERDGK